MPTPQPDGPPDRPDADILEEIRERRTTGDGAWGDVRVEGAKDVLCVGGEVWLAMDPSGLSQREDAKRPHLDFDELGQYINQVGNDVRQNKRAVKATPIGNGANDKTAEFRQNLIRQIEYRSNAQRDVYSPIFEDALQRSYGYGRVKAQYTNPMSRNQELLLEAFPNPDVVTVDPDGAMLAPDCSKIQWAFILDSYTRKGFTKAFPNATVTDFGEETRKVAPVWFKGDRIQVAEYWTIDYVSQRVVFLKADPANGVLASEVPGLRDEDIDDERMEPFPYVCQYLTNGVELLAKRGKPKRTPWPGKSIPIFSCFGKVLYVQNDGGTQRRLMSMIRLARNPAMFYSYARTCQAEAMGGIPRTTWVGYEGQFRGHEEEWAKAAHEPTPYQVVRATTPEAGANNVLPLPVRQSWDPPLQNLELAAEAARRAIQAAMGTSPLPTEAQRVNQKSGKALDRIESSGQKGSYHFVDHLDGMIARVGVLLDDLIPHYYDSARDVTIRNPDDKSETVRINDPASKEPMMLDPNQSHDITLSVGPAYTDERQASSDFADTIVENAQLMQMVGPQKGAKLIAQAIRLKSVGPVGDEMAETIDPKPPESGEPPTPQMVAELQAQLQQAQQQGQEAAQALETDQAKQAAQVEIARAKSESEAVKARADADLKWRIAQLEAETELAKVRMQEATKLEIAEYNVRMAQMQAEIDAYQAQLGVTKQVSAQTHESEEAERSRAAASDEAERGRAASAEASEAERAHAEEMAEAQRVADAATGSGA